VVNGTRNPHQHPLGGPQGRTSVKFPDTPSDGHAQSIGLCRQLHADPDAIGMTPIAIAPEAQAFAFTAIRTRGFYNEQQGTRRSGWRCRPRPSYRPSRSPMESRARRGWHEAFHNAIDRRLETVAGGANVVAAMPRVWQSDPTGEGAPNAATPTAA